MSQNKEIVCDRCGKDIVNPTECYCPNYALKNYSAKITLWGVGEPRSSFGQRIDLCPECYDKFVEFLEGGDSYQYDDQIVTCSHWKPVDGVMSKPGVAKDIEELEKQVDQIYNRYVFEDPDYTEDDVATEAAMNALTEVVNAIDELKKKYTEDMK